MAIYHLSMRVFSRSKGHSAVAAAAYRSGSQLYDERAEKIHRYDKRAGVAKTFIVAPSDAFTAVLGQSLEQFHARGGIPARAFLWNAVEDSEKRKNSCVARELILALPHELSSKERTELVRDMALYLMERYRVAVDAAIHEAAVGGGHDPRNHHAHLLFTTRELTPSGLGKKTRVLDDKKSGVEETELLREIWETLANEALKNAGLSHIQIDRRSLVDQGVDRIPQSHIGAKAKAAADDLSYKLKKKDRKDDDTDEEGEAGESSSGGAGGGTASSAEGETEEDTDGKSDDTSSSSSSNGGKSGGGDTGAMSLTPKAKELSISDISIIDKDYRYREQESLTRTDFSKVIENINTERAAFSSVPLREQIERLDQLMGKLDIRVVHLETLKERSSFSRAIKRSIGKLAAFSAETLLGRERASAALSLNDQQRAEREARQMARYGRTYRAGLHEQITEMKQHLVILKDKQKEYSRYQRFVQAIERRLAELPHNTLGDSWDVSGDAVAQKYITTEESTRKLNLKAQLAKEQVPDKFKPSPSPELRNTKDSINNDTTSIKNKIPIESNKISASSNVPEQFRPTPDKVARTAKPSMDFNAARGVNPDKSAALSAPYKQRVEGFDPLRTYEARQANASPDAIQNTRSVWFKKGGEGMKSFTNSVNQTLDEMYEKEPFKAGRASTRDNMSGAFNYGAAGAAPSMRTTTSESMANFKAKAAEMRQSVPEAHRGKPYPSEAESPAQGGSVAQKIKEKWQFFTRKEEPAPQSRPKMSSAFNKSSFDGGSRPSPKSDEPRPSEPP